MRIRFYGSYPIRSPQGRLTSTLMVAAGLLMCLFGIFKANQYNQIEDELVSVEAVIQRIEVTGSGKHTDYDAYVSYTCNGKEYRNVHLNWGSSSMKRGQTLTLDIHPDDPTHPVSDEGPFLAVGGGFFAFVSAVFWCFAWEEKIKEWSSKREKNRYG